MPEFPGRPEQVQRSSSSWTPAKRRAAGRKAAATQRAREETRAAAEWAVQLAASVRDRCDHCHHPRRRHGFDCAVCEDWDVRGACLESGCACYFYGNAIEQDAEQRKMEEPPSSDGGFPETQLAE
jgi:hypothetical protein